MNRIATAASAAFLLAISAIAQSPTEAAAEAPVAVRVRGLLLDEHLEPAAGVPVLHGRGKEPDVAAARKQPIASTAKDGTFDVTVTLDPEEPDSLLFGGERFAVRRLNLSKSEPDVRLGTLAMARGFTAIGRVRTADGGPLTGAVAIGTDMLDSRAFLIQGRYRQKARYSTSAKVSARGIFQLPGMVRSAGEVEVQCEGYYDAKVLPVAMGTPLDVTLHPAPIVTGRVVDSTGAGVAGVRVSVGSARAETDEQGNWSLRLRDRGTDTANTWTYQGGNYVRAQARLPDDGSECLLTLDAPIGDDVNEFRVQVTDADGERVEEFEAFACWLQANRQQNSTEAQLIAKAAERDGHHADAEGGAATLRCAQNSYEDHCIVYVRAPGFGWGRADVERKDLDDEPVKVQLQPEHTMAGVVVDDDTGAPIAGAEVVVTPKIGDQLKQWFDMGFYDVSDLVGPFSVATGADGSWRMPNLAKGEYDVLVLVGGKRAQEIRRHEITGGEGDAALQELTFEVRPAATLRGKLEGDLPRGLEIRPHWHRDNMSSTAWITEYDGALPVAANGTFELPDLGPVTWRPEVLLPVPPRGGLRQKLHCKTWDAKSPPKEPWTDTLAEVVIVTGRVGGEIPWHRLAVLCTLQADNMFMSSFAPPGVLATVDADRTFRMQLPATKHRLILLDCLTGISLAFRDVEVDVLRRPVEWSGDAYAMKLQLRAEAADVVRACTMHYAPEDEHWPVPQHPAMANQERSGMQCRLVSGDDLNIWLPARSGTLKFESGDVAPVFDVALHRATVLEVTMKPDAIVVEQR